MCQVLTYLVYLLSLLNVGGFSKVATELRMGGIVDPDISAPLCSASWMMGMSSSGIQHSAIKAFWVTSKLEKRAKYTFVFPDAQSWHHTQPKEVKAMVDGLDFPDLGVPRPQVLGAREKEPASVFLRLREHGAEIVQPRVDAIHHLSTLWGLLRARIASGVVAVADLLHADLQLLALYNES